MCHGKLLSFHPLHSFLLQPLYIMIMISNIISLFLFIHFAATEFSPLRLIQKQIQILHNNNSYEAVFPFQNSTHFSALMCFSLATKTTQKPQNSDTTICNLEASSSYTCFQLKGEKGQQSFCQKFTRSFNIEDLNITGNTGSFKVGNPNEIPQIGQTDTDCGTIQIYPFQIRLKLDNFLEEEKKIYSLISCEDYNRGKSKCNDFYKLNWVHTFINPEYANNLIVQRNHYCGVYEDTENNQNLIYNHIFYGGALRNNDPTMFIGFLIESTDDNAKINMWGGFGYTDDHTNKDMFCFSNVNGQSFDALSLLLGAPYKDIAVNIEGEESTSVIGNSYSAIDPFSNFYFIQYYRNYDTGDFIGDDRLFQKIGDSFAYAAYFHKTLQAAVSCSNKNYKHQLMFKMPIDLSLTDFYFNVSFILVLLLALLIN